MCNIEPQFDVSYMFMKRRGTNPAQSCALCWGIEMFEDHILIEHGPRSTHMVVEKHAPWFVSKTKTVDISIVHDEFKSLVANKVSDGYILHNTYTCSSQIECGLIHANLLATHKRRLASMMAIRPPKRGKGRFPNSIKSKNTLDNHDVDDEDDYPEEDYHDAPYSELEAPEATDTPYDLCEITDVSLSELFNESDESDADDDHEYD